MTDSTPDVKMWARIVPRRDTIDPAVGLAACISDPLWLLARQFQFGEFTGDDGADPTNITVRTTWTPFTRWRPGDMPNTPALPYDRLQQPLEALVEDDRALAKFGAPSTVMVVEAGLRLIRRLRSARLDAVVIQLEAAHMILPDPGATRFSSDIFAGRAVDGFSVRAAINEDPATILPESLTGDERSSALEIVTEWCTWFDARHGYVPRETAWLADRLEHRFSVAAPHPDGGDLVFSAPEYLGQGIAWHDLDLNDGADLGAAADAGMIVHEAFQASFPQPLRWPGMPVDRFWEMEDAVVDFGVLSLRPTHIAGMLAVDLAMTAGTDWYLMELPLPLGGAARVDSIVVEDVFGDHTLIRVGERERIELGRLFEHTTARDSEAPWLVLPPVLLRRTDGPPLEEVLLLRDELANLAWAVELTALLADGEPADVASVLPPLPDPIRNSKVPAENLEYRLSTGVPDNWRPLVPIRRSPGNERIFTLDMVSDAERPTPFTLLTRQLEEMMDEEIPREGKLLQRFWQYGRWRDGSRHLWCGREVRPGTGEGNSALRFDLAI